MPHLNCHTSAKKKTPLTMTKDVILEIFRLVSFFVAFLSRSRKTWTKRFLCCVFSSLDLLSVTFFASKTQRLSDKSMIYLTDAVAQAIHQSYSRSNNHNFSSVVRREFSLNAWFMKTFTSTEKEQTLLRDGEESEAEKNNKTHSTHSVKTSKIIN